MELRRLHADLIMCYKIAFGLTNRTFTDFFKFSPVTATRCHKYKQYVYHCKEMSESIFSRSVLLACGTVCLRVFFTSLHRFKHSILKVDFKEFLTINVDG